MYVDKTELVYRNDTRCVWLYILEPSPLFRKSLLTSTLHSYFEGRKDLFRLGHRAPGEKVDKLSGASFRHEHGKAYGQVGF